MKTHRLSTFLFVLFALSFLPITASAACVWNGSYATCANQGEAFELINNGPELCKAVWGDNAAGAPESMGAITHDPTGKRYYRMVNGCRNTNNVPSGGQPLIYYATMCSSREVLPAGTLIISNSPDGSACDAGCKFKRPSAGTSSTYQFGGSSSVFASVLGWEATGDTCTFPATPKPKAEPECVQEGTLTQCLKPDGTHCARSSSGTEFCWGGPSDTAPKINGNEYASRGPPPLQPPATPPPGTNNTWNNTTNNGPTTINNYSGTTNTTNNYNTGTGQSSGGGNNSGGGSGENPGGETGCNPATQTCTPTGSTSGGATCASPPTCTGDPINCGVLMQVWHNRCSDNGNTASGGTCTAAGTVNGFSCSGDKILCEQTRIAAERNCRENAADQDGDGRPDWTDLDGTEGGPDVEDDTDPVETFGFGVDNLDTTGFLGGGGCPQFGVLQFGKFGATNLDEGGLFCTLIPILRAIILFAGAYAAIRILLGVSQ